MRGIVFLLTLSLMGCGTTAFEEDSEGVMLSEGETAGFAAAIQGRVKYCKLVWSDEATEFVMEGSTDKGCSATISRELD